MREAVFLGNRYRSLEDALAEKRLDPDPGNEVHPAPEDAFEVLLQPNEIEETDRPVEVHQEIHIAFERGLITRYRAKERDRSHPLRGEIGPLVPQNCQDCIPFHEMNPCTSSLKTAIGRAPPSRTS